AAAPLLTGTTVWGALLLFWPGAGSTRADGPSPERVRAAGRRLGRFLRDAAGTGHALGPGPAPRTLVQPPARKRGPAEALAAAGRRDDPEDVNSAREQKGRPFSHVCHAGCSACFMEVWSAVRHHTDAAQHIFQPVGAMAC
ncbi:hypothetical protein ACFV2N_10195, partial [Streptomyces sp. NPDC059680]